MTGGKCALPEPDWRAFGPPAVGYRNIHGNVTDAGQFPMPKIYLARAAPATDLSAGSKCRAHRDYPIVGS
jgi:hypothetical protein